jgi:hypothetical protein
MELLKRFGYYFVGLSLGIVAVYFFWQKKNVTFDYLPNARTLKNMRVKKRLFSADAKIIMQQNDIDSLMIAQILQTGNVDFGKSKPRQKPCREYWIDSENLEKKVALVIVNCDSTTTIKKVVLN